MTVVSKVCRRHSFEEHVTSQSVSNATAIHHIKSYSDNMSYKNSSGNTFYIFITFEFSLILPSMFLWYIRVHCNYHNSNELKRLKCSQCFESEENKKAHYCQAVQFTPLDMIVPETEACPQASID